MLPMIIIQYVIEEPNREKVFTQEMEKAAILCFSETKRRKQSILRGLAEETQYIVKQNYFLQAVPWRGRYIVIDGLNISSTIFSYNKIPSVQNFTEDLKSSSTSFSLFKKNLKKHERTFEDFTSDMKVELKAIISDSSALDALNHIITQSQPQKDMPETNIVTAPIMYDRININTITENFEHEWQKLQADVSGLRFANQVLREETDHHKEKNSVELNLIWGSYENRIFDAKKDVDKKVSQLKKEMENESAKVENLIEKEKKELDIERRKARQKVNELKRSLDAIVTQKRIQKHKYPKRSTTRIDNRISIYQDRIAQANSEFHHISDLYEQIQENGRQELEQIKNRYQNLTVKEMEKLEILEQSRNLEMAGKRKDLKEVEDLSLKIGGQIDNLITKKGKDIETFEKMTLRFEAIEPLSICIPYYAIQYRLGEKTRIDLYPPMKVASYEGIMKRIQKAIFSFSLEARMQLLLSPRLPDLNSTIFDNLQKCLSSDLTLKEQIMKDAATTNLLTQPDFKKQIIKGLAELESEGWLNSKEKENILSIVMHD
jgi:hypothetical protein